MAKITVCGVLLAGIAAVVGSSASAQDETAATGNAVFIDMRSSAPARETASAALLRKANERGQVRVIVGLTPALRSADSLSEIEEALQASRLRSAQNTLAARVRVPADSVTHFDTIPFVSLWVNADQLRRLVNDLGVVNIQEDVPGTAGLNASGPFIKAKSVWNEGFKGNGFTVAVLDTGVDKHHPMFRGRVVSEACYSTKNGSQQISSFCPGRKTSSTASGSGMPCPGNLDPCWHGTHVAGIAMGKPVSHGSATLRGIAPNSKLIAINVFSKQNKQVVTFASDWVRGLERVFKLRKKFKIAAVNMSLGFGEFTGPCDNQNPAATKAIKQLRDAGIAVLVASMNDSKDNATRSPACITEAITVGATGRKDNSIANFSNHAPWVRMMAPGVDIVSARAGGTIGNACVNKGRGHCASSGTSMATPHVAGAFAMLRDVRSRATVDDIAAALECTGTLTTRAGIEKPRINVLEAKKYLLNPPSGTLDFVFPPQQGGAPGWENILGQWQLISGFLQETSLTRGYKIVAVRTCSESQTITAENMWRVNNVGADSGNLTGVIFKTQFTEPSHISGYWAAYARNGQAHLIRFDRYNVVVDAGQFVGLCSGTANSSSDFNSVRVVTSGGSHAFYVNNALVCTAHDRTYGTGYTGVFAFLGTSSGANGLALDRFIIDPTDVVRTRDADLVTAAERAPQSAGHVGTLNRPGTIGPAPVATQ